jgi:hypothetical protein
MLALDIPCSEVCPHPMQHKRPIPTVRTKSVRVMALVGTFDCVPKVINCIFVEAAASNGS